VAVVEEDPHRASRPTPALALTLFGAGLAALVACAPASEPEPGPEIEPAGFVAGPVPECDAPVSGLDRFVEQGEARGFDLPTWGGLFGPHRVAVEDLDGDGDLDVLIQPNDRWLHLYRNDGRGNFTDVLELEGGTDLGPAFVVGDLDGDDRRDIVLWMDGLVWWIQGLGGGDFAEPTPLPGGSTTPWQDHHATIVLGDADGDGDLDVLLPVDEAHDSEIEGNAGPDRLVLLEDVEVVQELELVGHAGGSRALVGFFTDRDLDGDQDVFIPSDLLIPSAFYRNDGPGAGGAPILVDDAAEIGADLQMGAMAFDSADLDGDGTLDYCITDTGPARCLLNDGGSYYDAGLAMGLYPAGDMGIHSTIGWHIDLVDLDNDGILDAVQASGPMGGFEDVTDLGDRIWRGGLEPRFEDITDQIGFGDPTDNFGLATADLDGDGSLEIVVAGFQHPPRVWDNACGDHGWVSFELVGLPPNTDAFGARLELKAGPVEVLRELYSMRGMGQGPSRFHVGIGPRQEVDEVVITWPDGAVSRATDLPASRPYTVYHPER
jgi:hypothetical protein